MHTSRKLINSLFLFILQPLHGVTQNATTNHTLNTPKASEIAFDSLIFPNHEKFSSIKSKCTNSYLIYKQALKYRLIQKSDFENDSDFAKRFYKQFNKKAIVNVDIQFSSNKAKQPWEPASFQLTFYDSDRKCIKISIDNAMRIIENHAVNYTGRIAISNIYGGTTILPQYRTTEYIYHFADPNPSPKEPECSNTEGWVLDIAQSPQIKSINNRRMNHPINIEVPCSQQEASKQIKVYSLLIIGRIIETKFEVSRLGGRIDRAIDKSFHSYTTTFDIHDATICIYNKKTNRVLGTYCFRKVPIKLD